MGLQWSAKERSRVEKVLSLLLWLFRRRELRGEWVERKKAEQRWRRCRGFGEEEEEFGCCAIVLWGIEGESKMKKRSFFSFSLSSLRFVSFSPSFSSFFLDLFLLFLSLSLFQI